jgi:hypothetical protein
MKTIQSQEQNSELRKALETIIHDLVESKIFTGNISIERILPPVGFSTDTPAGYPHLMVLVDIHTKVLGLFPLKYTKPLFVVKEGFYDPEETGEKKMFVIIRAKKTTPILKKHLDEFGKRYQVTEIVYRP